MVKFFYLFILLFLMLLFFGNVVVAQLVVYSNDFEGVVGPEWSNTSTEVTPVGGRRFLGRFGNNTIRLILTNLPNHTRVRVSFELFIIHSWDGNGPFGPDIWELRVENGPVLLYTTFSNASPEDIRRQAYPEFYPFGNYPGRTGASELDSLGYLTPGLGPDTVYRLSFTFFHTSSSATFLFFRIWTRSNY